MKSDALYRTLLCGESIAVVFTNESGVSFAGVILGISAVGESLGSATYTDLGVCEGAIE